MDYTCIFCSKLLVIVPLIYRGKPICSECLKEFSDIVNGDYQGHTYQQETPYAHCKECGKEFSVIFTPYPHKDSDCCYMCYVRMVQREKERQDRYACHECNKTFFTAEPNWFEGKRYCFECFNKLKKKNEGSFTAEEMNRIFEEMFKRQSEQQRRNYTFDWDFVHGANSGPHYYRTYTSSSNTSHASSVNSVVQEAFKTLGLAPSATAIDIKKAFKALALKMHPDTGGKHDEMVKLNKAKETCLAYVGVKK